MDKSKGSHPKLFNPFRDHPEEELQKRLKHGKRLTREEFAQRVQEAKTKQSAGRAKKTRKSKD
jgi:hypothetical protein